MSLNNAKTIVLALKYTHSCLFSPGGLLMVLILIGVIPLTWISVLAGIAIPLVSGFTNGAIKTIENAVNEIEAKA